MPPPLRCALFRSGVAGLCVAAMLASGCRTTKPAHGDAANTSAPPPPTAASGNATTPQEPTTRKSLFSWLPRIFPQRAKPPVAVPPTLIGQIRQVNVGNQFVLIDASSASSARPGEALVAISDRQETADLKLTTLRGGSFLIADIVSGEPSVGDRVYQK